MKHTVTLQKAFSLLKECSAVILEDDILLYPSLSDIADDPENEFCYIGWEDDEGLRYITQFNEGANQNPTINDNQLVLIDTEGEECSFKLLTVMNI